jgi:surface protein
MMNGINISAGIAGYLKTIMLASMLAVLTACGGGSGGSSDAEGREAPDTTAPVITLNGEASVQITEGTVYAELGATATDNVDGTISVTISGSVSQGAVGAYIITYTATDAAGNSSSITRTIEVLSPDTTAPVITLNGSATVQIIVNTAYIEQGATATDDRDSAIVVNNTHNIDITAPGAYVVTYTATDAAGNAATLTRTVVVLDTTAPVITLNGNSIVQINAGGSYLELGATATDNVDGTIVVSNTNNINTTTPGTYLVTYTATDAPGNTATLTRTVIVLDPTAPVIILNGSATIQINEGTAYVESGATATDNTGSAVTVSSAHNIDAATPGTYYVTYTASDAEGNTATLTRTVIVLDTTAPVITLNGSATVQMNEDTVYSELGATATDNVDGVITVNNTHNINTATPGTYVVTYTATDSAGNTATLARTVVVSDTTAPAITLNGGASVQISANTTYTELGATAVDNVDGTVSVTSSGSVNNTVVGTYVITYSATDVAGNSSSVTRTVQVLQPDYIAPVITLIGGASVQMNVDTPYSELGVTVTDNVDTFVNVSTQNNINVATPGTYLVTYSATDSAGNTATLTRTVIVLDTTDPVITLNGSASIETIQNRTYIEMGATAQDNVDGTVTVTVSGNVDTDTPDTYTLTYTATDAAGNTASLSRDITVREELAFITTWKTDNTGGSNDDQITILTTTQDQNYTVDWGDGNVSTNVTGHITHTYDLADTYTVSISGDFRNIRHGYRTTDAQKLLSIDQWGDVQWTTMEYAFSYARNLVLNATDTPDLSAVTNMGYMFYGASVFNGDLSQWDVSAVTNMDAMFNYATAFNGDLSQWDVSAVTNIDSMFYGARAFNGDLSQWDVSAVTSMRAMFTNARVFNGDISQWDVSAVTSMGYMFYDASVFNSDLSQWDVSAVTNMDSMFYKASVFNSDLSQWDVSAVTNMDSMFYYASVFNSDLSQWDVSAVTNMGSMFNEASVFNGDLSQWDVSAVTNMRSMFGRARAFNSDLSQWDVSAVTNMDSMFYNAIAFNGDLSQWDVSAVTSMRAMFYGVRAFNGDLSQWDVSSVTNMSSMFGGAKAFNGDLSEWDVSSVTHMGYMFNYASDFNGDISQWDVSSVTDMEYMFNWASAFNGDLSQWDVSSVTDMEYMFNWASAFKGDISQWDVSAVTNMEYMFYYASDFNSDLSQWDVSSVTNMKGMLGSMSLSTAKYDALLQGWSGLALQPNLSFHGGYSKYSAAAQTARDTLVNSHGWTVTDGGLAP